MAKSICESSLALSICSLKRLGYLDGYRCGTVSWTRGWSGDKCSIGIYGFVYGDDPYLRLRYSTTGFDGVKNELDYRVDVVSTPCHFGGKRYWLVCPLSMDGVLCRRRVGVIYGAGKYYGCRRCYDLAYKSQQETRSGIWGVLGRGLFNDLDEKEAALRVKYWHGRPTKRYARLLRKMDRAPDPRDVLNAANALNKRSN